MFPFTVFRVGTFENTLFCGMLTVYTVIINVYTAGNATDLLQVVDFTGLLQVVNKLQHVCENQTCCNLIFADLLQVVETTCNCG